MISHIDVQLE